MKNHTRKVLNAMKPASRKLLDKGIRDAFKNSKGSSGDDLQIRGRFNERTDEVDLLIMGEIGESWWGESISGKYVTEFLRDHRGKNVRAKVDTPGGDVFDGMSIMNGFLEHDGNVTCTIVGLCYSAGSYLVMGADTIEAYETSSFGIHPAWSYTVGNKFDHDQARQTLDSIDGLITNVFAKKTGMSMKKIEELFVGDNNDGVMLQASEALELGFIDKVIELDFDRSDDEDTDVADALKDKIKGASSDSEKDKLAQKIADRCKSAGRRLVLDKAHGIMTSN